MLTIRSIRFNSNISDEQLRAFFGEGVVEIVRGAWMSDVRVYSDEAADVLRKRLDERYEEWKARKDELRLQKGREDYARSVKELYDGVLGLPINRWNNVTKQTEYGYTFLDPDDNGCIWIEVWPEFPVILKHGLVYQAAAKH